MLYKIVKPIIRFALLFFCKKIVFNNTKYFAENGPLLLAANHPNSFLDAIIIGSHFKKPVYFLARGDAFKNKWGLKILTALKCIPVYRISEGKENLHLNDITFEKCRKIFEQNGIVLIFSEGLCENEWIIRKLKKGTARLAFSSWELPTINDKLKVLPVGINYNSYKSLPKKIWVNFGNFINKNEFDLTSTEGKNHLLFNEKLNNQFQQLCIDDIGKNFEEMNAFSKFLTFYNVKFTDIKNAISKNVAFQIPNIFNAIKQNSYSNLFIAIFSFILSIPALLFIFPFYILLQKFVYTKTKIVVHYDSILFGITTLFFTLLLITYSLIFYNLFNSIYLTILIFCLLCICTYFLTIFVLTWRKIWYLKQQNKKQ